MTNKFTEKQYQKIVSAWDFEDTYAEATQEVIDIISVFVTEDLQDEALALANPLTREWAHDKFVEKEKKYYWTHKKGNKVGLYETNGLIFLKERYWAPLTESEVLKWGYKLEMFNREEL